MEKLFILFVISFTSVLSLSEASNYTCDYSFGDQSWETPKKYYDEKLTIPEGSKNWNVTLPHDPLFMISFVCVNITNVDKNTTDVYFSPLYHTVKVELAEEVPKDTLIHIVADRHGY